MVFLVMRFIKARFPLYILLAIVLHGVGAVIQDPVPVWFSDTTTVGPDGPWNVINQTMDFPDQYILMFPSLSKSSTVVPQSACSETQSDLCPGPFARLWKPSAAQSTNSFKNGDSFDADTWDPLSEALNITGSGHYMQDRITLYPGNDKVKNPYFMSSIGVTVAENFTISYSGGAAYTMNTGYFSLYGEDNQFSWKNKSGADVTMNRTIAAAWILSYIPSMSYGLHIGSAVKNVSGSLYVGGFDGGRLLGDPIAADDNTTFSLVQISLNASSVPSVLTNLGGSPAVQKVNLKIRPEPGVPYLYLPRDVCDGMAKHLPVTYNSSFGLYFWNTGSPAYLTLISTPHFISFDFNGGSITIPFALLNLNLTAPLSTNEIPYFPCRPYTPSDGETYILGRAFLQGAFLAQNWHTQNLWLGQAPGPDLPTSTVVPFPKSSVVTPSGNDVNWESTWKSVFQASDNSTSTGSTANDPGRGGLSSGAKAAIGIGVVAIGVIVSITAFIVYRRRQQNTREHELHTESYRGEKPGVPRAAEILGHEYHEMDNNDLQEMEQVNPPPPPVELPTTYNRR